jgi:hypothetical protein
VRVALADFAERLREGDGEFAALPEGKDGIADLLGARHPEFAGADAGDQALHPLVSPGPVQPLHEVANREPAPERRPGERTGRPAL